MTSVDECAMCARHRGAGPLGGELVLRRDGFWVYHGPPGEDGLAPLGYLQIDSDRHVPYLADLTPDEAGSLGRLRTSLAAAIRETLGVEFVFAAVIGTGIAHFHEHVLPRPTREPADVEWHRSDELLERGDGVAVRALAAVVAEMVSRE